MKKEMRMNLQEIPRQTAPAAGERSDHWVARLLGCMLAVMMLGLAAPAQSATAAEEARRAQCPEGDYSGPGTGAKRFYQDPYVWFVSREFAARFCVPESYIDDSLKGALALAVRIQPEGFPLCGMWMGRSDQCSTSNSLLIDVYVDNKSANIPKADPTVEYFSGWVYNSGWLMGTQGAKANRRRKGEITEVEGERRPFTPPTSPRFKGEDATKFILLKVRNGIADEAAHFIERYYRANWVAGIDLITLDAYNLGYGKGQGTPDPLDATNPVKSYAIGIIRARDERPIRIPVRPGTGFGYRVPYPHLSITHAIELPSKLFEIMDAFDNKEGEKFFDGIKQAIQPQSAPAPAR